MAVMIFNYYQPPRNVATRVQINRPQIMSHNVTGKPSNVYRVTLKHGDPAGTNHNYEVWATKEAIKDHFYGQDITPYHVKKFARQMYENRIKNGITPHEGGLFVTSTQKIRGNPTQWPQAITDNEIKV